LLFGFLFWLVVLGSFGVLLPPPNLVFNSLTHTHTPTTTNNQIPQNKQATQFAEAIHAKFPGKLLAYNCSPSFNWKKKLTDDQIATFQQDLSALGKSGVGAFVCAFVLFVVGICGSRGPGVVVLGERDCLKPRRPKQPAISKLTNPTILYQTINKKSKTNRLQVPVRDARRLPRAQLFDVLARARVCVARHGGLRRPAGAVRMLLFVVLLYVLLFWCCSLLGGGCGLLWFVLHATLFALHAPCAPMQPPCNKPTNTHPQTPHPQNKKTLFQTPSQEAEFAAEKLGYAAVKHQAFVGTGYFDLLAQKVAEEGCSTTALAGSTEAEQFH
jgi:hypothetical protein